MNKNVLIVLIGGFVVAILVAVLVQASLGGKKSTNPGSATLVLVAAKDLPVGTELAPGDLKWQAWPGNAFAGAIIRKKEGEKAEDALKGRMVQRVAAGQPVLETYIFKEGRGNLVAATLGANMRAMAIPVKANTMVGGFISPGDYVDVVLTYKVKVSSRNTEAKSYVSRLTSETILQNIKVLAVDQEASREEDEAKVARTVTLEVTPEGSQKLSLAAKMGDITLALRGIGDEDKPADTTTTDVQLGQTLQSIAKLEGSENGGRRGSVRIYNGTSVRDVNPRANPQAISVITGEDAGANDEEVIEEDVEDEDSMSNEQLRESIMQFLNEGAQE
jgi:pilus assembly protein CpaB